MTGSQTLGINFWVPLSWDLPLFSSWFSLKCLIRIWGFYSPLGSDIHLSSPDLGACTLFWWFFNLWNTEWGSLLTSSMLRSAYPLHPLVWICQAGSLLNRETLLARTNFNSAHWSFLLLYHQRPWLNTHSFSQVRISPVFCDPKCKGHLRSLQEVPLKSFCLDLVRGQKQVTVALSKEGITRSPPHLPVLWHLAS